jgi:magnesium-transporting ATPase (P-type)
MTDLNWQDIASNEFKLQIESGIALNTASQMGATDKAMDEFITRLGCDKKGLMGKHLPDSNMIRFPFSSNRKRMSTIIENVDNGSSYGKRICLKGASEIVMASCDKFMNDEG